MGEEKLIGNAVNRDVCVCVCVLLYLPLFLSTTDLSKCQTNLISACRQSGFIYCASVCMFVRAYTYVCAHMCLWSVMAERVKTTCLSGC